MGKKYIIVTGGCGFIGSNFIRLLVKERPDWSILNLDALTYAGNLDNLRGVQGHPGYRFVRGDIANEAFVRQLFSSLEAPVDYVVNFAAESHVDRSILGPKAFIETNVNGVFNLLECVRAQGKGRFLQVSTDEVFGSLGDEGAFSETTPIDPSSPYSASKAASSRDRSRSNPNERDLYGELSSRLRDLYAKAGAPDLYNWRFRPPPGQRSPSPV